MIIGDYSAVLDACVLHPVWVRDALLYLADERLFKPLWSAQILDEWQNSLAKRYPDKDLSTLAKLRSIFEEQFEEAMVHIPSELLEYKQDLLPDPKDNHVLFAAICGRADAIVTSNLKDFPADLLAKYEIEVRHPDDFLLDIINLDGQRAVAALQNHRQAWTKSCPTPTEFVEYAKVSHMHQTYSKLQNYLDVL